MAKVSPAMLKVSSFKAVSFKSPKGARGPSEKMLQDFIRNRRPLADADLFESLSKMGEYQPDKIIELHADDVICCVDTMLLASESQYIKSLLYSFELMPVMVLGGKVKGDALLIIVDALHSGVIQFRESLLESVLQAASFLQLPSVLETLAHMLRNMLTVDEAVNLITLGEKYSLPGVRSAAEALLCRSIFSLNVATAQAARHSTWFHAIPYERMLSLMELSGMQATNSSVRFLAAVAWAKAARVKRAERLESLLETINMDLVDEGVIRREVEKIEEGQDPVRVILEVCLEEYELRKRCRPFKTITREKEPPVVGLHMPTVCQFLRGMMR